MAIVTFTSPFACKDCVEFNKPPIWSGKGQVVAIILHHDRSVTYIIEPTRESSGSGSCLGDFRPSELQLIMKQQGHTKQDQRITETQFVPPFWFHDLVECRSRRGNGSGLGRISEITVDTDEAHLHFSFTINVGEDREPWYAIETDEIKLIERSHNSSHTVLIEYE